MKHTPGPWKIDKNTLNAAPEIVGTGRRIAKALYYPGSEDAEVHHNALLIAAAPELLEALEITMLWIENWSPRLQKKMSGKRQNAKPAPQSQRLRSKTKPLVIEGLFALSHRLRRLNFTAVPTTFR